MTATVASVVLVKIDKDRPLTLAFLKWTATRAIYTVRGAGGAVGPDFVSQVYPAEHADDIRTFLAAHKARSRPG